MRAAILMVTLTLTVASCGDSDDDSAGDTSETTESAVATTAAPETTAEATTAPATDAPTSTAEEASTTIPEAPADTTPATDAPVAPAGEDCLVGEWVVTQDEMNAFYDAVEANVDGVTFEIIGEAGLTFTETQYVWGPDFDLTLTVAGLEGNGVAGGSISGTYTTADGVITTTLESSEMTMQISMGGTVMDASDIGNDFMTSVPINDAPYSCETGVPVIDFETGDGTPRHPVTLIPA